MLYGSIMQRMLLDHEVAKQTYSKSAACNKLCLLIGSGFAKLFKTDKERERQPWHLDLCLVILPCCLSMVLAVLHYINRCGNCKDICYMYLLKHDIFIPSLTKVNRTGIIMNVLCNKEHLTRLAWSLFSVDGWWFEAIASNVLSISSWLGTSFCAPVML